jgi:hypothetical protein
MGHLVSSWTALAFGTNTSEERKSTSPSAIQVKTVKDNKYWGEIRCNKLTQKRVNEELDIL